MTAHEPEQMVWQKSSYSAGNGACVEVGLTSGEVRVRDTKDREGGELAFAAVQWRAFLSAVHRSG